MSQAECKTFYRPEEKPIQALTAKDMEGIAEITGGSFSADSEPANLEVGRISWETGHRIVSLGLRKEHGSTDQYLLWLKGIGETEVNKFSQPYTIVIDRKGKSITIQNPHAVNSSPSFAVKPGLISLTMTIQLNPNI